MRRILNALTIVGIAAGCYWIYQSQQPPSAQPKVAELSFREFQPDKATPVRFNFDDSAFSELSRLDCVQQMRDWMLYTIIAQAALPADDVRKTLADLPPARLSLTQPVANLEWGETRSRAICVPGGKVDVLALVPAGDAAIMADQLAHVADQQRKNLGEIPRYFHVFEYTLDPDAEQATLTYRKPLKGEDLYTARFGFVEQRVDSLANFEQFMAQIDAIVGARLEQDALVLCGRRIEHLKYRGIRVEDVAALWQSEMHLRAVEAEVLAFEAKWRYRTPRFPWEKARLEREYEQELAALKLKLGAGGTDRGLATGSGFSLDTVYKHEELRKLFPMFGDFIERLGMTSGLDIDEVGRALDRNDEGPLLKTLYELSTADDPIARSLSEEFTNVIAFARFQHARYDGLLRGTEVGMVLFYTDLLAKLWALDYLKSAPGSDQVAGFIPLLKVRASPVYAEEIRVRSRTRLWLGPQEDGFQKVKDGILFARNGTRVYAASSNPLKPGEEAEPNVESEAFLGWWNNNYEAVARYEREYERLNEIMKWSLLLGWLGQEQKLDKLSFLEGVAVARNYWFPDWARRNEGLRFNKWDQVRFLPRGFRGVETESLEILYSELYLTGGLSGGVSLGSKKLMAERSVLEKAIDPALRRSNFRYSKGEPGKLLLERYDKTTYDLSAVVRGSEASLTARARPAAKFRSLQAEIRNSPVETRFVTDGGAFRAGVKVGNRDFVDVTISRQRDGFAVQARGREVAQQNAIRRLMDGAATEGREAGLVLAEDPAIEVAARLPEGSRYLVKVRGSENRWLLLKKEEAPAVDLPEGADLRWASGTGGQSARWNGNVITPEAAAAELKAGRYLKIERTRADTRDGMFMEVTNRGPPGGTSPVDFSLGGLDVKGLRQGSNGPVWVDRMALPETQRLDPRLLARPPTEMLDPVLEGFSRQPNLALAKRLAADPKGFKQRMDAAQKRLLDRIEQLEQQQRPEQVVREVGSLPEAIGSAPELRLRQSIAEIEAGHGGRGARRLKEVLESSGRDPRLLDQKLQELLRRGDRIEDIKTSVQTVDLDRHLTTGTTMKGSARVVQRPGGLAIEAQLLEARMIPAKVGDLKGAKYFYLEESPRLGNLDPAPGMLRSVDQLVGNANTVEKLISWEIEHTKPEFLVHEATGTRYRRIDIAPELKQRQAGLQGRMGVRPPTPNFPLSQSPCAPGASLEDKRESGGLVSDCGNQIYLVRISRPDQPRANTPAPRPPR